MIEELIDMAKEMQRGRQARRGAGPRTRTSSRSTTPWPTNESAVEVMGDKQLAFIAHELLQTIRQNVTIDWTVKQSARARIKVLVKRMLKQYGYPPDLQEAATDTVLEQAELLAADWAMG